MNDTQTIVKIREYACTAQALAETVLASPPANLDATHLELVREIARIAAALELTARGPVKIGVVGQFNAGKTLLLGGLIGYADGLPVSAIPTTGNVTSIRFRQRD